MNAKTIDLANIVLMIISCVAAFLMPFELFLFSYAVLGPLHYLTEINWLKGKNYFVKEKKWIWVFALCAALIAIPLLLQLPVLKSFRETYIAKRFLSSSRFMTNE